MNLPLEVVAVVFIGAHLLLFIAAFRSRQKRPRGLLIAMSILGYAVLILMNAGVAFWGIARILLSSSAGFASFGLLGIAAIAVLVWGLFEMFESFNADQGQTEGHAPQTT